MDPLTITAAINAATKAYAMVKKCVEVGRDIEDTASYFTRFFDAKERIAEAEVELENGPRLFRGKSVEAEALEIQMAKHKTEKLEAELRELILYTVGQEFYTEMMRNRAKIRQRRLDQARARAARKKMLIDGSIIAALLAAIVGVIGFSISLMER